jgi:MFS family permease
VIRRRLESIGGSPVVLALSTARLGDAVGNSILFIVLPLFVAKLPAPAFPVPESVRVGFLISLYGFVNALAQPFMGAWSDRAGKRKPFIQGGLALMAVGTLGFLFSGRFIDLLVLRSLQGVGVALTLPAAVALLAAASQKDSRGGTMGIYTTMRMVGLSIGPLLGGFLVDRLGFAPAFYAGAAFIFLGMVLVQLFVKDVPVAPSNRVKRSFHIVDRDLLSAGILGAGFASFVMATAFSMMAPLEVQFNERLNETVFDFGIAFSALMVGRFIFQLPLGRLSDHIGRKPVILAGLIFMAPTTGLLGYAETTGQLIWLRFLQGLASAGIAAPAFAVAADLAERGGEGRQMSIITMAFGLGIASGPLLAGVLAVRSLQAPFLVGATLCLVGAFLVYRYVPETVDHGAE